MSITSRLNTTPYTSKKRKKKMENQLFYWALLLGLITVIVCAILYIIKTWKDPPPMLPLVDQIDIGRHNDKPEVKFLRATNRLFYVSLIFKYSIKT